MTALIVAAALIWLATANYAYTSAEFDRLIGGAK